MARVEGRALADDVLFAPGNVFSVSQSAGSFMRFNVAMMEDPKIFRVLQSAMTECARTRVHELPIGSSSLRTWMTPG